MTTRTRYDFDTDTSCTPVGEHEYGLDLVDRWNTPAGRPNGGYLIATCLQALRQELPLPDVLSASAHYLRPGSVGPARIRTDVARIGRRTATGQAILTCDEREIIRVLATFTDLSAAEGPTLVRSAPPVLPPPEECLDPLAELANNEPGITAENLGMAARVSYRMPHIPGFWRGAPGGTTAVDFWMRFADGREPDALALAMLVDGAIPAIFDLGGIHSSSTIELTAHIRQRPAPGWLACRVTTNFLINGFHEEDFEIWDSMGALVAQSRQLAIVG